MFYEADAAELIERCRERLFAASRSIAAAVARRTVLAEIQIVRYHVVFGCRAAHHEDKPMSNRGADARPSWASSVSGIMRESDICVHERRVNAFAGLPNFQFLVCPLVVWLRKLFPDLRELKSTFIADLRIR